MTKFIQITPLALQPGGFILRRAWLVEYESLLESYARCGVEGFVAEPIGGTDGLIPF